MLEFLQAITGVFVVVYDGQHALKFTLGRAGPVVGPGVHWKWPIVQKFRVEETKHTTLDLEPQVIQLADDLVYEVDCKVLYQIVNLRKALIEIDDLVTGLKNRVVLAVQRVVGACTRESIRDTSVLIARIVGELASVEEQWGVRILQLGFSNISPSTTTLEITQLELLAREKQGLYRGFRADGLSEEAAVALIAGAVVAVHPPAGDSLARELRTERDLRARLESEVERVVEQADKERRGKVEDLEQGGEHEDDEDGP
jgi:regulator of protease activity HflC (stomatin/prohibitin superfamily)